MMIMTKPKSNVANTQPQPRRGRPRSAENDRALMDAARDILSREGFEGLSFDALARLSGVSRPSIYRRWSSKSDLLAELAYGVHQDFPSVTLEAGLAAAIRQVLESVTRTLSFPAARAAILGATASIPSKDWRPGPLAADAEMKTRETIAQLTAQAKERGLMRQEVDPDVLYDLVVGGATYRSLFSYRSAAPEWQENFIDAIVAGVGAKT